MSFAFGADLHQVPSTRRPPSLNLPRDKGRAVLQAAAEQSLLQRGLLSTNLDVDFGSNLKKAHVSSSHEELHAMLDHKDLA